MHTLSASHITGLIAMKQLSQSQVSMTTAAQQMERRLSRKSYWKVQNGTTSTNNVTKLQPEADGVVFRGFLVSLPVDEAIYMDASVQHYFSFNTFVSHVINGDIIFVLVLHTGVYLSSSRTAFNKVRDEVRT